jgi:hypothetical protein
MSDFGNVMQAYYDLEASIPTEPPITGASAVNPFGYRRKRNPPPKVEPALAMARTQAEWHLVQEAMLHAETPVEEWVVAAGEVQGVEPAKQKEHQEQARRQGQQKVEQGKKLLEELRQGHRNIFDEGGPRSASSPASTPGYVPAPVQGQVPPLPGGEVPTDPSHEQAHQRIAEAHRQASGIHTQEGRHQPAQGAQHAQAAAAHEQQALIHEMESRGRPNAPEAPETADRQAQQDRDKERLKGQTQVTEPPQQSGQQPGQKRDESKNESTKK